MNTKLKKKSLRERLSDCRDTDEFTEEELQKLNRMNLLYVFCMGCGYKKEVCRCMPEGRPW